MIQEFENNYSLLSPLICEAVAVKEDRRVRTNVPSSSGAHSNNNFQNSENRSANGNESVPMEEVQPGDGAHNENGESRKTLPSTLHLV
jgi:hypothetical protein